MCVYVTRNGAKLDAEEQGSPSRVRPFGGDGRECALAEVVVRPVLVPSLHVGL